MSLHGFTWYMTKGNDEDGYDAPKKEYLINDETKEIRGCIDPMYQGFIPDLDSGAYVTYIYADTDHPERIKFLVPKELQFDEAISLGYYATAEAAKKRVEEYLENNP